MFSMKKGAHRKRFFWTRRISAIAAATAVVAGGFVGIQITSAPEKASAHDRYNVATCEALTTDNKNFAAAQRDKSNTIKVIIDGKVVENRNFGTSWVQKYPFSDKFVAHTWSVQVIAWDDNVHYGYTESGTSTPCVPPVTKDASASASAGTAATCLADSTVHFAITNATWDTEADLTVGSHTRTATADAKHVFSDGSAKATVTYVITAKLPAQSSNPKGECYTPPPAVKDADASVSTGTNATCTSTSTPSFAIEHASWNEDVDTTVGTHTRTATADEGHLFADGNSTKTVSYTVDAQLPSQSTDKDGPCYVAPPVVKDASASVTIDDNATCTTGTVPKFGNTNATWNEEADLTVGTHTRTATANEGHVFADGTTTATVTYTVKDKLPSQSTDKDGPCYVAPPKEHTTPPSVTPTPGHTPSATPTPSKSPVPTVVVPHNGTPPKGGTLAFTGTDVPVAPMIGGSVAVVMLGLALLLAIRRRKASEGVVTGADQE